MSDEADVAFQFTQLQLEAAKALRKPEGLPFTGFCHNCEEPLEKPHRYCDVDCRDDHDLRRERSVQNRRFH